MMLSTDFTNEPAGDARARKQLADHAFCSWRAGGVLFVHERAWLPAGKRVNSWLIMHSVPRQPAVSYLSMSAWLPASKLVNSWLLQPAWRERPGGIAQYTHLPAATDTTV